MSQLAPNLFDRRFQDLMEIGRSRIPALAPEWTDHNAHDPGIMLMEMLAWVAEAQLYSLAHLRRDERTAYGSLLGISASGTQSATGLIWSDRDDPKSPATTLQRTMVISENAAIRLLGTDAPAFVPTAKLLWMPGRIDKLETHRPRGTSTDHTTTNERGGSVFLPFGEKAGPRDVLTMRFVCRDPDGMFGSNRANAIGAYWPVGVRVSPPIGNQADTDSSPQPTRSPLTATLVASDERVDLRIAADTTRGFLTTGVILLDLDGVKTSHSDFTIELRSPGGFARPPRVLSIEPNVLPIQQSRTISGEIKTPSNGDPDMTFVLDEAGLKFAPGDEPVSIEIDENGQLTKWRRCKRLSDEGPDETAYELDTTTNQITFGNGVNGRIPASGSQILASYKVSDGEAGNVARNRKWEVAGFEGVFGVNPDPVVGGTAASDFRQQRREARRRIREWHALVSTRDIESAARSLSLLEVARAWVVEPGYGAPRTGTVTLVAMRARPDGSEPEQPPETARWLAAIRNQLAQRIPLGSRLAVTRPDYSDFTIEATIEVDQGLNPSNVKKVVEEQLRKRLALLGAEARRPGVPVNRRDVGVWMRGVDGVTRVSGLRLRDAVGKVIESTKVLRSGLPRWKDKQSDIDVKRAESGRSQ